ncbi:uncharacterized protein LOC118434050 [Folsomia candida]|uniref:uncharacterized protein LOC118434050 n=1 Tax=Folsomia candida TaxID=158441 RepID=UPI0016053F72|nr:uncharacterized protein LOC118434050 [Folsomia candida]XP_035702662.1 uncharacterized protein LOC118434050 [Folsomia candida]
MAARFIRTPDGVFKAKFNTEAYYWSVVLPYVDHKKYTIGHTYTSWETQGDFIFFRTTCTQLGTWNWNFGLEILCEDHEYWVKALKGDEIFKNGVKLDDEVKKPLNFGDTFTMIKRRNDISGGLAIFSFEKREYRNLLEYCRKTCASDNAKELNFMLDRNQLIFSKVLSHLSVRSLKNARLVCRHWDEEVTPVLQKIC